MPGFMPGIHALTDFDFGKAWMAGTSPAMTDYSKINHFRARGDRVFR